MRNSISFFFLLISLNLIVAHLVRNSGSHGYPRSNPTNSQRAMDNYRYAWFTREIQPEQYPTEENSMEENLAQRMRQLADRIELLKNSKENLRQTMRKGHEFISM